MEPRYKNPRLEKLFFGKGKGKSHSVKKAKGKAELNGKGSLRGKRQRLFSPER